MAHLKPLLHLVILDCQQTVWDITQGRIILFLVGRFLKWANHDLFLLFSNSIILTNQTQIIASIKYVKENRWCAQDSSPGQQYLFSK